MYHLGSSFKETEELPLWQIRWYIERTKKEYKEAAEAQSKGKPTVSPNSPAARALSGARRAQVPARLKRKT